MKGAKDMIDSRNKRSNKKITFHKSINGKKKYTNKKCLYMYICL